MLHVSPKQLGELREKDPDGISFLEQHIIWEANERHKQEKEAERKRKKPKRRH